MIGFRGAIGQFAFGRDAVDAFAAGAVLTARASIIARGASVTSGANAVAPGDTVQAGFTLIPGGAATGNGSMEICY